MSQTTADKGAIWYYVDDSSQANKVRIGLSEDVANLWKAIKMEDNLFHAGSDIVMWKVHYSMAGLYCC